MAINLSKSMGSEIPADKAKEWIKRYQDKNRESLWASFFGSDILQTILTQKDCAGIRIYNAIADDGTSTFVIVGAKENGNNIWPSSSADSTPNGVVGEFSTHCPPACADNE